MEYVVAVVVLAAVVAVVLHIRKDSARREYEGVGGPRVKDPNVKKEVE